LKDSELCFGDHIHLAVEASSVRFSDSTFYGAPSQDAIMPPKQEKQWYYAVARGRTPGIYFSWKDCKAQVHEFSNARYKKFETPQEADKFIKDILSGEQV
jgi:viroplasmin